LFLLKTSITPGFNLEVENEMDTVFGDILAIKSKNGKKNYLQFLTKYHLDWYM
jgi:hypothetical protein